MYNLNVLLGEAFNGVFSMKYADVAQLVEQLIRNQQVAGSSPATSSIKRELDLSFFVQKVIWRALWIYVTFLQLRH